ncbi:MAG: hypothetical protein M3T96_06660 [Acidobacteriota bacterium]|nr:hypothetical protein [Acidobacteriota bacterium]
METNNVLINLGLIISLLFCMAFACNDGGDKSSGTSQTAAEKTTTDDGDAVEPQDAQTSPRSGKYDVLSYGADPNNPLRLGYFELSSGGKYKFYQMGGKSVGGGDYRFDAASNTVEWTSGIFKDNGWGGAFEVDREGKTHKIRLTRTTIGTNSTDQSD